MVEALSRRCLCPSLIYRQPLRRRLPRSPSRGYSCTKLLRSRGAFRVVDVATARATVSPVTPPSARQLLAITAAMLRRRVIRSGHRSGDRRELPELEDRGVGRSRRKAPGLTDPEVSWAAEAASDGQARGRAAQARSPRRLTWPARAAPRRSTGLAQTSAAILDPRARHCALVCRGRGWYLGLGPNRGARPEPFPRSRRRRAAVRDGKPRWPRSGRPGSRAECRD